VLHQLGTDLLAPGDPEIKRRSQGTASAPLDASPDAEIRNVLVSNINQLSELGEFDLAHEMMTVSSRFRRIREAKDPSRPRARETSLTQLARGSMLPRVLCFSGITPPQGSIQYARFASALSGLRDVWLLPNPGFARGELLPIDWAALVRTHAENVLRSAASAPFALVGHSASGLIAHAVASHLESLGVFPVALVMLDTYLMADISARTVAVFRRMWLEGIRSVPWTDDEATAWPWYGEILKDFIPRAIKTRTLFARATEPVPGIEGEIVSGNGDFRPHWAQSHDLTDLPGNHLTIMTHHSDSTARLVHNWLSTLEA
jgi:hypothetical protein